MQTVSGILLLYLWADVREIKREWKSFRREHMRNSLGGRTSEQYPGFSEEAYWKDMEKSEEAQRERAPEGDLPEGRLSEVCLSEQTEFPDLLKPCEGRERVVTLKPGEEQVLRDILLEFLG